MSITDNAAAQSVGADAPAGAGGSWVRRHIFLLSFGMVALVIAGVLSYAASSSPDGLDSATMRGCETVEIDGGEALRGNCIAQHADDHVLASSPLADYSVSGLGNSGGIAGVIGVGVTVLVAVGLFWLLARSRGDLSARSRSDLLARSRRDGTKH